ncbi:S2611-like protein [Mya arenaria]|uniref:S2611-like protein n=1 Tax=Mya arenaria TaxID=6604 RepID=A0ABY7DGG4_MYAAR|nr:S2611-like protein [Mya arenaria]
MSGEREPLLGHAGTLSGHGSLRRRSPGSEIEEIEQEFEEEDVLTLRQVFQPNTMKQYVKRCCNVHDAKNKFPIIKWLPKYSLQDFQCDLISGLTVALTVLPQGLAYAVIANLPPQDITLGPTAIMSLMTAAFASSPIPNDPTYALILTLVCGVVQFLMGVLHLGIMVNFISYPVINAFTSAAAITIAFGQVKGILGLHDIPREFLHMVYETCKKIPETRVWDLTMGLSAIVVLLLMKQLRKIKWRQPGPNERIPMIVLVFRKFIWLSSIAANAIIVITCSGIAAILEKYGHGDALSVTGHDIGAGLIVVPILGLVESIAIGKAFARQNNYKILPNQELLAIGAANIMSSFVSAYPVTGSFSRTAVNSQSGVRTPMAGVWTGGIIILALAFLTPLFEYVPKSALSAVIISAVIQMVDYEIVMKFWKIEKLALIPWAVTFLTSFGLGIEYGILIGIGVHLLILLYPVARPRITVQYLDYVVITFNQSIRYPSVEYLQNKVTQYMYKNEDEGVPLSVILDCQHLTSGLDYTTIMGLIEIIADFKRKDVHFSMAGVKKSIIKELNNADVKDIIYGDSIEDSIRKIKEAEKHGSFEDQLESITIINGKLAGATAVNASPVPGRRLPRLAGGVEPRPVSKLAQEPDRRLAQKPQSNLAFESSDSEEEDKPGSPSSKNGGFRM